ncbi:hypothetical protein [Lentzea sp. E54]|uniref:hypothetical protein n=1 Tax=Lentzea xerophila TaxID=3435883 RepID=UPI003DA2C47F
MASHARSEPSKPATTPPRRPGSANGLAADMSHLEARGARRNGARRRRWGRTSNASAPVVVLQVTVCTPTPAVHGRNPCPGETLQRRKVGDPLRGRLTVTSWVVCGTDKMIVRGDYGRAPAGAERLVLGHESLARVREAPQAVAFARETSLPVWCAGVILSPVEPAPRASSTCAATANTPSTASERVLVTGAGPIGLLTAMLGVQRGLDVHVLDRVSDGPKPRLVREFGATYHHEESETLAARLPPDVVVEATGAGKVVVDVLGGTAPYGIVCLTGVSTGARVLRFDAGAVIRELVLENDAVIGSVNANLRTTGRLRRRWPAPTPAGSAA